MAGVVIKNKIRWLKPDVRFEDVNLGITYGNTCSKGPFDLIACPRGTNKDTGLPLVSNGPFHCVLIQMRDLLCQNNIHPNCWHGNLARKNPIRGVDPAIAQEQHHHYSGIGIRGVSVSDSFRRRRRQELQGLCSGTQEEDGRMGSADSVASVHRRFITEYMITG